MAKNGSGQEVPTAEKTAKPQPIRVVWQELVAARHELDERDADLSKLREIVTTSRRSESHLTKRVDQLQQDLCERDQRITTLENQLVQHNERQTSSVEGEAPLAEASTGAVQWVAASQVAQLEAAARALAGAVRAREARLSELEALAAEQAARIATLEEGNAKSGQERAVETDRQVAELKALACWQASRIAELEADKAGGAHGGASVSDISTAPSPADDPPLQSSAEPVKLASPAQDMAPADAAAGGVASDDQGQPFAGTDPIEVAAVAEDIKASDESAGWNEPAPCTSEQAFMTAIAAAVAGVLRHSTLADEEGADAAQTTAQIPEQETLCASSTSVPSGMDLEGTLPPEDSLNVSRQSEDSEHRARTTRQSSIVSQQAKEPPLMVPLLAMPLPEDTEESRRCQPQPMPSSARQSSGASVQLRAPGSAGTTSPPSSARRSAARNIPLRSNPVQKQPGSRPPWVSNTGARRSADGATGDRGARVSQVPWQR